MIVVLITKSCCCLPPYSRPQRGRIPQRSPLSNTPHRNTASTLKAAPNLIDGRPRTRRSRRHVRPSHPPSSSSEDPKGQENMQPPRASDDSTDSSDLHGPSARVGLPCRGLVQAEHYTSGRGSRRARPRQRRAPRTSPGGIWYSAPTPACWPDWALPSSRCGSCLSGMLRAFRSVL